ncbi:MAG: hypothetical protein ICV60_11490 [Pyrinomonadaceae bacterium]|nr:hypothetical protein [Pyrinomonadaceae bacterium]
MNFGEALTYWYLRLNGFFPLSNFVLHRAGISDRPSADTDLLAIRFPHVYEVIGGQPGDWDTERFNGWNLSLNDKLALIVEVKTGMPVGELRAWRSGRLRAALQRLGMFEQAQIEGLTRDLQAASAARLDSWVVAKLLVSNGPRQNEQWNNLLLEEAETFVRLRLEKYKRQKYADRMFFPNELIQYLAWKA